MTSILFDRESGYVIASRVVRRRRRSRKSGLSRSSLPTNLACPSAQSIVLVKMIFCRLSSMYFLNAFQNLVCSSDCGLSSDVRCQLAARLLPIIVSTHEAEDLCFAYHETSAWWKTCKWGRRKGTTLRKSAS
jgi:hypothetical protein